MGKSIFRQPRRRWAVIGLLAGGLGTTIVMPPRPLLVWNVSQSAPVGLYAVGGSRDLARGELVIAWVPQPWRDLAAARHYLPANVPLVKRVAGVPGDRVCAVRGHVYVNDRWAAWQRPVDGRGRTMPAWIGCTTLAEGSLFLLMDARGSFDGRYFGPTESADIIGRGRLIWAR
jgi:conjugative transfer signal peptidase TraF